MPRYPRSIEERSLRAPDPEWPLVDIREISVNATEDIEHGSTRALLVSTDASVSFVPAIEDHTYTAASATVGAGNSRFDATAQEAGTSGNSLRVVVASSSTATAGLTISTATASGITTITLTFRTGSSVTAEAAVLIFNGEGGIEALGDADAIAAARAAITLSLTTGSDGSGDLAPVASTALTGGSVTIGRRETLPLRGGFFHPISARLLHSITPTTDSDGNPVKVFGGFDPPDRFGER